MRQRYIFTSKYMAWMFDSSDEPALAKLRVDEYYSKGKRANEAATAQNRTPADIALSLNPYQLLTWN